MHSKKSKRMVSLTPEEIQQLTEQVMKVNFRGKPSELKNQMISFINGECKNKKQGTSKVSLEDIFLDEYEEELL